MIKVAIIQTTAPDYRTALWSELQHEGEGADNEIVIFAGAQHFDPTIVSAFDAAAHVRPVRNVFVLRRRGLAQLLPIRELLSADVVIAEANPRILSTLLLMLFRWVLGQRTLLWGHAVSRSQRDPWLRRSMRHLSDGYICYTDTDARYLSARLGRRLVVAAPNAVARASEMRPRTTQGTNFVYVGRMVDAKRPTLLLEAFIAAADSLPPECRLVFAGDGPLLPEVRSASFASRYASRIDVLGHVSDESGLTKIYGHALAAVSPGYVGLSIIQAHGYGVPMIVADAEPHAPEIEAAKPGSNSLFFRARSAPDLAKTMRQMWQEREAWIARAPSISRQCADRYSVEAQAAAIWRAARDSL